MKNIKKLILLFAVILSAHQLSAQKILDEVIAIVSDHIILRSDLQKEIEVMKEQGFDELTEDENMQVLNELIERKILLQKAQFDSLVVQDERVDGEIERKLYYILLQFNNDEQKFQEYLGKSVLEFKAEIRPKIKEQILIDEMKAKILNEIRITPSEVVKFYNDLNIDSLPKINSQFKIATIEKTPKANAASKIYAWEKINQIRQQIMAGGDFANLAILYSDDPGTSGKGGELGYFTRGQMVPEFEAAAFKLRGDSISKVVESPFGYHIIQLIDRKGQRLNVRHILIKPKVLNSDMLEATLFLDSLKDEIINDSLSFTEAAKKYSENENTKGSGGLMTNQAGEFFLEFNDLDKETFVVVKDLKKGDVAGPVGFSQPDGTLVYKLFKIIDETEPHNINLKDDYILLQKLALEDKKKRALEDWLITNKEKYYIYITDLYKNQAQLQKWIKN